MVYQTLHQPPRLLGGQTVPVRCACNVEGRPAAPVLGYLSKLVFALGLGEGVEHRLTVVREERVHKHGAPRGQARGRRLGLR